MTKFIILDTTQNTGKEYISSNGANVSDVNMAIMFDSEKQARDFASTLTGNNDWFSIMEHEEEN